MTSLFSTISRKYIGVICLSIITIILFAGLWPRDFHFGNQAAFLPDGKGIRFSGRGIIFTPAILVKRHTQSKPGSLSIETVIQSDEEWGKRVPVIIAFYDGQSCERLIIVQWKSTLIVQSRQKDSCQYERTRQFGIGDTLSKGKSRFISITSNKEGTAVYVDGYLKEWRKKVSLLDPDEIFSGQLLLGNSSDGKRSWTGTISTFAIYDEALSSGEVLKHFEAWRDKRSLPFKEKSPLIAYYRFDEKTGPIIKDHTGQGNDLIIPERFTPLHHRLLTPPWNDFRASRSYALDVAINILGFVPFGFYISWYLWERSIDRRRIMIVVMILGAGVSLFIEVIQAYLPARSSQLLDVITNTGGTALGIFLWHHYIIRLRPSARDH